MTSVQSSALAALEPFILLSKSATSPRAAAELVTRATSHPHTYVFAELLETPNIQALRSSNVPAEYAVYYHVLEMFAWGSIGEYLCQFFSTLTVLLLSAPLKHSPPLPAPITITHFTLQERKFEA